MVVRRAVMVFSLATAMVAAGCSGPSQPPTVSTPVTIGLLAPATGAAADAGLDALRGTQLAADVINHSHPELAIPLAAGTGLPGLHGRALALVSADTAGAPGDAGNQAGQVIANGAVAIVMADSAEAAAAAGSQAQRLHVPLVDAVSTADYVTELGMDWYFRTVPSDRSLAASAFAMLQRQLAGTSRPTIAILAEAETAGAATTALVRDLAERAGYTVSPQETLIDHTHAGEQARRIDQSGADVVLALVSSSQGATEVTQVTSRLTTTLPVIGFGPGFGEAPQLGPASVVLRTASWSAELAGRSPAAKAVNDLYASRFGVAMTDIAANAFTATITVAAAIDAAGSTDPAAIRAALRQTWLPATQLIMPWNGVRFDTNGQNELAAGVVEGREAEGFRVVFPRELATGPMIWATGGAAS